MKGATLRAVIAYFGAVFQSTLPMKGATKIHIPYLTQIMFQSTLPMKGATQSGVNCAVFRNVSIHAPNEGSDA